MSLTPPRPRRAFTRWKIAPFFTGHAWSSALKRIAAAGPALVLPQPAAYEDLVSVALGECGPRCVFFYDVNSSSLCDDLRAIANAGDGDAYARAEASTALVHEHFALPSLSAYMLATLDALSAGQDLTRLTEDDLLNKLGYVKVVRAQHIRMQTAVACLADTSM
jgi:hypothetical protein